VTRREQLAELVGSLSLATEAAVGVPPETTIRAAVVSVTLARALELGDEDCERAYLALAESLGLGEPIPQALVHAPLDVPAIALSFARCVDLKSPWTLGHSTGVASLAARPSSKWAPGTMKQTPATCPAVARPGTPIRAQRDLGQPWTAHSDRVVSDAHARVGVGGRGRPLLAPRAPRGCRWRPPRTTRRKREGDDHALEMLLPLVEAELRRIAQGTRLTDTCPEERPIVGICRSGRHPRPGARLRRMRRPLMSKKVQAASSTDPQ
jgi:hypothetical protein